ncbi:MAG: DUF6174 domain-containing protein [Chloroflexota bacterium]|nr:DUF6174 domain-containing protein [Chloroflexota bacterium]
MSRRIVYSLVAGAMLLGVVGGMLWANATGNLNINRQALDTARARWQAGAVAEYEVTLQYGCYCPVAQGTWTLRVRDNQVEPVYTLHDGRPFTTTLGTDQARLQGYTVEGQFATIEGLLSKRDSAFTYTVRFDPVLGYPTALEIHPKSSQEISDGDLYMTVTNLTTLRAKNEP